MYAIPTRDIIVVQKVTLQAMPTGTHTAKTLVEAACPKPRADINCPG